MTFGTPRLGDGRTPESVDPSHVSEFCHDRSAFARIYMDHLPAIYRYLRARLPTDEDANDVSQQVFLKALEAFPTYEDRGIPIVAWLFRIARNAATDRVRVQRRLVSWQDLPDEEHPFHPDQPEIAYLHLEALEQLNEILNALSKEDRDLVILRFVADLSTKEIAAVLGKTDEVVRTRLSRALRRLQRHVDTKS